MTAFPKYKRYKDSGVEWLGEIPEHWESEKGIRYFHETDQRSVTGDEELLSVSHLTGVTPRSEKNITMFLAESNVGLKVCEVGDLAVNTMWAWMAALGISKYRGIVSPSYSTYRQKRPEKFNPTYIDHLLRIDVYKSHYMVNSTGITTSRLRLYPHSFLRLKFICPPREEQDRIVTFLDRKTAEIDALIAKKQRQIELLDEQKAILINRAVTRGLNPNPKLKPSGIEWIGEIPEGWNIVQLQRLVKTKLQYGANEEAKHSNRSHPRFIRITDFDDNGTIRDETFRSLPPEKAEGYLLDDGDLLFARSGATVGKSFIFRGKYPACFAGYLIRAATDHTRLLPEYLYLLSKSPTFMAWKDQMFSQATIQNIGADKYGTFPVILPPLKEQAEILEAIDVYSSKANEVTSRCTDQIQSLKTLRSTLIAHAVTGRIKV